MLLFNGAAISREMIVTRRLEGVQTEQPLSTTNSSSTWRFYAVVSVGAGAFGALVGTCAALSASPIVKTLLPLLFAVISGAGVFKFAKNDPLDKKNYHSLIVFGITATSFSVFCIVGTFLALYLGSSIANHLSNRVDHVDVTTLPTGSPLASKPFQAIILRNWLESIGIANNEITKILTTAPAATAMNAEEEQIDRAKSDTYEYMIEETKDYYNVITSKTKPSFRPLIANDVQSVARGWIFHAGKERPSHMNGYYYSG